MYRFRIAAVYYNFKNLLYLVTPALREPVKGWTNNFNGLAPLLLAVAKGLLKVMHADLSICGNNIPVDTAAKMIIVAAWKRGTVRYGINNNSFSFN